jgi:uncharacterized membrane-anchored protein
MNFPKTPLFFLAAIFVTSISCAQTAAAQKEIQAAVEEGQKTFIAGPRKIKLADQAILSLPANEGFFPAAAAVRMMHAGGVAGDGKTLLGIVVSYPKTANWINVVEFKKDGYVRDDEAGKLNADDFLAKMREGTEQSNVERRKRGLPELSVAGWAEAPYYDAATHKMSWSVIGHPKDKGMTNLDNDSVNYRTIALGREGYLSLTMVSKLSELAADKPIVADLLAGLQYNDGKRYSDFSASTDHVAEYGLAALVVGVVAKKIGVLALILAFMLKFFKIAALSAGGIVLVIKKLFNGTPKVSPVVVKAEPVNPPPLSSGDATDTQSHP